MTAHLSLAGDEHARTYHSFDSVQELEDHVHDPNHRYPEEYLHSLNASGLPPHILRLKPGMPIVLLRNINPGQGLANGTRLVVERLCDKFIVGSIANGCQTWVRRRLPVFIPRCNLQPSDNPFPFTLTRRQFSVCAAFAITINKAQGQTFERVGIFLPKPCFSHGQLYVAMSRVGSPAGVTIMALPKDGGGPGPGEPTTANVVYTEVLR